MIYSLLPANGLLVAIYSLSLLIKINVFVTKNLKSSRQHKAWLFLVIALSCLSATDVSWLLWLCLGPNYFTILIARLGWALYSIFYVSLFFLIESLLQKNYRFKKSHQILLALTAIPFSFFVYAAFSAITFPLEFTFRIFTNVYGTLLILTLFKALYHLRTQQLPKILKKQLLILFSLFIGPFIFFDLLQANLAEFNIPNQHKFMAILSAILITIAIYYCFKKIFGLRFLNFKEHVHEEGNFNFIYDFKSVLADLGSAISRPELIHITKSFFNQALHIPYANTKLIIKSLNDNTNPAPEKNIESSVEKFINLCDSQPAMAKNLHESKILIYDEIVFSSFYEETEQRKQTIQFLDDINADIFLPIYNEKTIIGYIVVERNARAKDLYTNIERDEMIVFASYLSNIIYLLQNKNLDTVILRERALEIELYHKHQEINQYKESITSFLRSAKERKIGIVFYKNRRFVFGNQAAHEFIDINLNTQEGHPLAKDFKNIARLVESYKSPQSCLSKDTKGNRIVIAGLPHLEQNNVIFTIYYPEIADVVREQMDQLKDPSEWDYVLYLQTTQSGQLINQLIPGNGKTLLQFKIQLLKAALGKRATLIEAPDDDAQNMVEILHHISLRQQLYTLKLSSPQPNSDTAIKLFGINPIFSNSSGTSLLETLNGTGTLFIQNIHLLNLETQLHLANFIKYGFYNPVKSDQRLYSDAHITCSTNQNLHRLVQEGLFLESLYNELKNTTVVVPSLLTLPDTEFLNLTNEYLEQTTQTQTFKKFFELTERDKAKLSEHRPTSLHELKERVLALVVQKSKRKQIYQETQFNPAYNITEPELATAAKLGKHALRDEKMMRMLWSKFQSQNKIATFLGVNRSSVNRRCKDFNLS